MRGKNLQDIIKKEIIESENALYTLMSDNKVYHYIKYKGYFFRMLYADAIEKNNNIESIGEKLFIFDVSHSMIFSKFTNFGLEGLVHNILYIIQSCDAKIRREKIKQLR